MANRAKLFKSGGSQAVRLPKDYRFDDEDEVMIYRQGNRIILEGVRRRWWPKKFLELAGAAKEFPYPEEPPAAEAGPDFG